MSPLPKTFRLLFALLLALLVVSLAGASLPALSAPPPDDPEAMTVPDQRALNAHSSSPIALTSDNRILVVCNPDNDSISVFNVQNDQNRKLAEIRVGREPRSVAIHPNNRFALVTNQVSGTVSLIDLAQLRRLQDINVGAEPYGVVITADGREAWVTLAGANGLFRIITFSAAKADGIPTLSTSEPISVSAPNDKVTVQSENRSLRGIAIATRNGQEVFYMTQFLSDLAQGGAQMSDQGKVGRVFVIARQTRLQIAAINLAPHETGFEADRRNFGGGQTDETFAFPNQLQSIFIKNNHAYLPNTSASPEAPIKFDVDTQAFLGVININTNQEVGAFNINLNEAVKDQTATPKLFLAVPWAVAFENNSNDGYVVSASSNVLAKITLAGNGQPNVVFDNVANGTRVREIGVGKNPFGLVISSNDRRLYVMNYISRDVTVIDLTRNPETVIATFSSAALPRRGTQEDRVHIGKELFNTSIGIFDQTDPTTGQPVRGRMSNNGWQACVSCHPAGLTDGVVWQFPAGPRKSIPMNTSFNPHNPNEARLLNYSAIFDEINDFELNIRNVSGGQGVIITDTVGSVAQHPVVRAFDPANFGRRQLTVRGVNGLDAVTFYSQFGIRSPISPETANDATVIRGRQLFIQANCQKCHGGSFWTSSIRDFTPPPPANRLGTGQAPEPAILFVLSVLRQVGTFDPNNPVEHTAANQNQRPLGALGFNPPSLIGINALGPFNHNGECETLDCVLNNVTHRSAGTNVDVLTNAQDRTALAKFLRSIDFNTRPIPSTANTTAKDNQATAPAQGPSLPQATFILSAEPRRLIMPRGSTRSATIHVDGTGNANLSVVPSTVPQGMTAELTTTSGAAPFDTTLRLTTTLTAQNGAHFIDVCGVQTSPPVGARTCVTVPVNVFGYQLSAPVSRGYVHAGINDATTFVIQAESLGGEVPDVQFEVTGAPAGTTLTYQIPGSDEEFTDPPVGTPFDEFPFTLIVKVGTTATTPIGTHTLTIRANGDELQRETQVTLQVGRVNWIFMPIMQKGPE